MKLFVAFFLALPCTVLCSGIGFLTDVSGNSSENRFMVFAKYRFLDRVPVAINVNSQRLQFQIQGKYQVNKKDTQVINLPLSGLALSFSEGPKSPLKELLVKDLDGDHQHYLLCTAWQRSKIIQVKLKHTLTMRKNIQQAQKDLLENINSSTETEPNLGSSGTGENSSSEMLTGKGKSIKTGDVDRIHEAASNVNAGAVSDSVQTKEAKSTPNAKRVVFYQDNSESSSTTGSDSDNHVDASAAKTGSPEIAPKSKALSLEKLVEATAQRLVQDSHKATKRPDEGTAAVTQTGVPQESGQAADMLITAAPKSNEPASYALRQLAENQVLTAENKKNDSLKQIDAELAEPIVAPTNELTSIVAKSDIVANAEHFEIISEDKHTTEEPIIPIVEIQFKEEQPNLEGNAKSGESVSDAQMATLDEPEAKDAGIGNEEPATLQHGSKEESSGSPHETEEAPLEVPDEPQATRQSAMPDVIGEPKPSDLVVISLENEISRAAFEIQDAEIEPSHTHGAAKPVAISKMTVALQAVPSDDKLLEEEQSKRAANQERIEKIIETIEELDEYSNEIHLPQCTDELAFGHARLDETGDLKVFSGIATYSAGFWTTITASRLEIEWTRLMRETTSSKSSKARFVQWRPRKDECFTPTKLNDPNAVYHILGHDDRKLQLFPGVRLALSEMAEICSPTATHGNIAWNEKKTGMVLKGTTGISKQKEALSACIHWLQSTAPIDYFKQAQIGEDESQQASVIVHFPPLVVDDINNCVDISVYYATIYKQVFMTVATRATKPSTIYLSVGNEATDLKAMLAAAFEAYLEFAAKLNGADIVFVSE